MNGSFNWTLSDSNGDNNWDLVVTSNDTTAPTLSSSTPTDNATGVAVSTDTPLVRSRNTYKKRNKKLYKCKGCCKNLCRYS